MIRMSAVVPIALFGLIIAGGTLALTDAGDSKSQTSEAATTEVGPARPDPADTAESTAPNEGSSDLPEWNIDFVTSFIEFTAEQAGAPFTGEWQTWEAKIRFASDSPEQSELDVLISVDGVSTQDDDRDSTLQETEFFDQANHPTVRFRTQSIQRDGNGFLSEALLTIKGVDHPVEFRFEVSEDGASRLLSGEARLDRLALGVGLGEWADTEWGGQFVDVSVAVVATVE